MIEDVHWIDEVSESMFADFLTVIPQTRSMVLITYRPEYEGVLARMPGAAGNHHGPRRLTQPSGKCRRHQDADERSLHGI